MDWIALFKTIVLCLVSIALEAVSATKDGKNWFENLRQPRYSFPFSFWYLVGGLYYIICGVIAYRQFHSADSLLTMPIVFLSLIMVVNGLTNFILFKFRSLKMFYWVLYLFIALFLGLMAVLFEVDSVSFLLAAVYVIWLVYDVYYFLNLWRLNRNIS